MRRMIEKLLIQNGVEVLLGGRRVRALFQPMTGRLERLALNQPGPAGPEGRKRFVYIGPVEPEPEEEMVLTVLGKEYEVRTVQWVFGNDGPAYCWALCVERGAVQPWDMSGSNM